MPTANEQLLDYLLARQVGIQRLSLQNQRYMQRLLEQALREANRELARRLEVIRVTGFDRGPVVTRQIDQTINSLGALLAESYRQMGDKFGQRMLDLAVAETEATRAAIRRAIPAVVEVAWAFPGESVLRAIVRVDPMQGHVIGSYFAKTTKPSLVKRVLLAYREAIREQVAAGLLRVEGVDKVTRRVAAIVRNRVARWQLRNVVDTATKHVTSTARERFLESNAGPDGVVKGLVHNSTFDTHTTKEWCIPRHGKTWRYNDNGALVPVGHSLRYPPGAGRYHFGCRSVNTAWLRSWEELGVDANELTGREQASMDGQIPEQPSLAQWYANRQWSGAELVEMFGARRAGRIAAGELTVRGALRQVGVWA